MSAAMTSTSLMSVMMTIAPRPLPQPASSTVTGLVVSLTPSQVAGATVSKKPSVRTTRPADEYGRARQHAPHALRDLVQQPTLIGRINRSGLPPLAD